MRRLMIVLLVIALVHPGCRSQKELVYLPGQYVHVTDTVTTVKTIIRRDTVLMKAESAASVTVPLTDIKPGFHTTFKNKDASGVILEKEGQLELNCKCDSLEIVAHLKDIQISTLEKRNRLSTSLHPADSTSMMTKILAWVGGIALVFILLLVILKKLKLL